MANIRTFTAAVDTCVARSGRADRRNDIRSYVRLTMQELQTMGLFKRDLIEDEITPDADPYIWTPPTQFRRFWTVSYPALYAQNGDTIFPKALDGPGRAQNREPYYYYPSGESFVFVGHHEYDFNIAYFEYFPAYRYYETGTEVASFDDETNAWSYLTASTAEDQAAARLLVSNWILFNWFDVVVEGALAKLYKVVDDPRMSPTYALYKQLQSMFTSTERSLTTDGV